jgi:hypothetical protein
MGIAWMKSCGGLSGSAPTSQGATGIGGDGVVHFAGYRYWGADGSYQLTTPQGTTIGSTMAELSAAHGSNLVIPEDFDECVADWYVEIYGHGEPLPTHDLIVVLDGPPTDPTSRVTSFTIGVSLGC